MTLATQPYLEQVSRWPSSGRHILAHFDAASVVVYQAYRPAIAQYALAHSKFGGPDFSLSRMSWIKPNFLWMMYRSAWGSSEGQQAVLGIRIRRSFFEKILAAAVPSSYADETYETRAAWQAALTASEVRLQWDPDHDPSGAKLERRAIQLGLRGDMLRAYASSEIVEIIDMNPLVAEQRARSERGDWQRLRTPVERVYQPLSVEAGKNVGLEA